MLATVLVANLNTAGVPAGKGWSNPILTAAVPDSAKTGVNRLQRGNQFIVILNSDHGSVVGGRGRGIVAAVDRYVGGIQTKGLSSFIDVIIKQLQDDLGL